MATEDHTRAREEARLAELEERLEHEIVRKILEDLTDRRGLRQAWDSIDEDIQAEIKEKWRNIVRSVRGDPIPYRVVDL